MFCLMLRICLLRRETCNSFNCIISLSRLTKFHRLRVISCKFEKKNSDEAKFCSIMTEKNGKSVKCVCVYLWNVCGMWMCETQSSIIYKKNLSYQMHIPSS